MITRIFPLLIVFVAIGIFFAYINPTYTGKIAEVSAQIKSYDGALDAAKAFKEKQVQIGLEQDKIPLEGRDRIEAFMPDSVDNVQLILDLNTVANRSGVRILGFNVVKNESTTSTPGGAIPRSEEGSTDSLDVTVSAVGTYGAFRTFISNMEWSLRPLDLMTLSIADGQGGQYAYQMKFRIYWLR